MTTYQATDIRKMAKETGVKYLRLMFTDVAGGFKNIEVPIALLDDALDNKIKIDGSSIAGFLPIENSDMLLYPDLTTWRLLPWIDDDKTAILICNVHHKDGTPFEGDPRYTLMHELAAMKTQGFSKMNVGAEPEFFLFKLDETGHPSATLNDQGFYFDPAPLDEGGPCRRAIANALMAMHFHVEADHHEAAAGQHEIDFQYADAVHTADNVQLFKLTVKTIARQFGLAATFMPKPVTGINGSGMHLNVSLFKDNANAFYDATDPDELSATAKQFLAGMLLHAPAITALGNPSINSYKRLVPGYEAPVYIAWGTANRTPLVRVPSGRGPATRLELRSADPGANPYLTIAAILVAGCSGIAGQLTPPAAINENIYKMTPQERRTAAIAGLPGSLGDALDALQADNVISDVLGTYLLEHYADLKQAEMAAYRLCVSPWEHDRYFDL